MKRLMTIFGALLVASVVFTSCGSTDAKENGTEAGELQCSLKELSKEQQAISKKINALDWDKDEKTRKEIAGLEADSRAIGKKQWNIMQEMGELEDNQWTATKEKDDKKNWVKDFNKASSDYMKSECKDKEDK